MDAERPKDKAAQHPLRRGNNDVAFDRGANHGGEFLAQVALVVLLQRNGAANARPQHPPIAQQKEQQIQHDAEADEKLKRVLSNIERPRSDKLTALHRRRRQLLL